MPRGPALTPQGGRLEDTMESGACQAVEDFISGPLVTWIQTLETLIDSRADLPASLQTVKRNESPKEYFLTLVSGDLFIRVMEIIDQVPNRMQPPWDRPSDEAQSLQTLQAVLRRLHTFYKNELRLLVLSPPPNLHLIAQKPLAAQAVQEMKKLVLLLLGSAVQCERRDEIIGCIQALDLSTQAALASAIQEVTREPENLLRLQWKELGSSEMELQLQGLLSRMQELVQERDASLEKLWKLQQEPGPPLPENNHPHLGVHLAEVRAQVRHLQRELEERMEEILDQQEEVEKLQKHLQKVQQENRALAGKARLADLYRDELDVLQEKVLRTERLQAELAALRDRLPTLEQCRSQLKEEQEFSQALLETKAMLEEQLEAARAWGKELNHLEKEKMQLESCLKQAQEERDQLYLQTEALLGENRSLQGRLRRSYGEPLNTLRAEELDHEWAPSEPSQGPVLLSHEVSQTGQLSALERENQGLRRRLQEALESRQESGRSESEPESAALGREVEAAAVEEASDLGEKEKGSQGSGPESEALVPVVGTAMAEEGARLEEALQEREAEARRVSELEDLLRSLRDTHANVLEEQEEARRRWHAENERLLQEIQALEREREASQAGSQALQAAAAQAKFQLEEAQQNLQSERLQGSRLGQEARRAEEELCEARRELEALQRSLDQHKAMLARVEAEKGALEEQLSHAGNQQRQADKENRRLKGLAQAREEALAAQGLRLAHLESQNRQQATELGRFPEVTQRLEKLQLESASLREQLEAKCEASARLEEELQKEKAKGVEREATLAQLRTQLLKDKGSAQVNIQGGPWREEKQEDALDGEKPQVESMGAPQRTPGELHAIKPQFTNLLSEQGPPVTRDEEGLRKANAVLLPLQAGARSEALDGRFIEMERKNAVLQAEKSTLTAHLSQLESQISTLQVALLGLQGQSSNAKEESERWQAQNSALQVEAASLRSKQALQESQLLELRQRLAALETDAGAARQQREEWRGRYESLLRDHDRLALLHERQSADLEGLLSKQAGLKGALRSLEQQHRDLQARHSELLGQKAGLEEREGALQRQKERLEEAERHHRELAEEHSQLKEEHERVKETLSQAKQARDDLQAELRGTRNRMTNLQLEQARLEAETSALKEQNQQLDVALGRLSTQCELLAQLKGNQEQENHHLLQEIQALSKENRRLLERSMESREHFQEEQRQYLDKLGELRREKQKLVEKIMDQYRVLDPALPRGKKSSWIAEKIRKLMKPRRETPREHMRPLAEGAGSSESLTGADGIVPSAPGSPAPLQKSSSSLSIADASQVCFRRHRLSSRMPGSDSTAAEQDTARQRFRQRRLGMLGGSREEAAVAPAVAEWETPSPTSASPKEERGLPLGAEKQAPACQP